MPQTKAELRRWYAELRDELHAAEAQRGRLERLAARFIRMELETDLGREMVGTALARLYHLVKNARYQEARLRTEVRKLRTTVQPGSKTQNLVLD